MEKRRKKKEHQKKEKKVKRQEKKMKKEEEKSKMKELKDTRIIMPESFMSPTKDANILFDKSTEAGADKVDFAEINKNEKWMDCYVAFD